MSDATSQTIQPKQLQVQSNGYASRANCFKEFVGCQKPSENLTSTREKFLPFTIAKFSD